MRLGEIRNIVKAVAGSNNQIVLTQEPLFGGQAHQISRYSMLIKALDVLSEQKWNDIDYSEIEAIKEAHGATSFKPQLTPAEFNELNSYVTSVNQQLPVFIGIIDTLVEPQEEQVINVKLPKDLRSLTGVSSLNTRLNKLFKLFNIDGEIRFNGFDKGTDWYSLWLTGYTTYTIFIACLQVAQEYFKARTEYFKSEKAEIDYRAGLKQQEKFDQKEFEEYQNRHLEIELERKIEKLLEKITETNGHGEAEMQSKLVKATTELVKELGSGVEFHLSLNPPSYAKEINGALTIDYKKIQEINKANNPTPELEARGKDPTESGENANKSKPAP